MRIAVALFEGAEELDWAGPWEVLSAWANQWPDDGVEVFTVAETREPVTSAKGLRALADTTWDEIGDVDVLVYPGGRGTRAQLGDDRIRARLRALAAGGTLMTSVCTGSLDLLGELGAVEVRPDARFVDTGEVVTAAGVSAGIDMALHLVARLHSPERAREVRRYIQYDPEPPV